MLTLTAAPAAAAAFTVSNTNDSGAGSLRQAITDANTVPGADSISFGVSGTITLESRLPAISGVLTLDGTGQSVTISGNNSVRVMQVAAGASVNLSGLTITQGASIFGAIKNGGTLVISDSTFSGNSSGAGYGGAIVNEADSLGSPSSLTVTDSTFTSNTAENGSAIYNGDSFGGGTLEVTNSTFTGNSGGSAIYSPSVETVTVTNSTFSGNTASFGGAIASGPLSVTNSTFSDNTASYGGAIASFDALTVTNSTFSGNSATDAISGYGGAIDSGGALTVTSTTFARNRAEVAGSDIDIYNGATATLRNTILGSSGGSNCGIQDAGTFADDGFNLSSDTTCVSAGSSLASTDPLIGTLANTGGQTQTLLPAAGSPAIDGGGSVCPTETDQRGISRPQGAACDIGAAEVEVEVVTYPFSGFFFPVANPPKVNPWFAGLPVPIRFGLGGNEGAGVVTGVSVTPIDCVTRGPSGPATVGAISKVVYLPRLGQYGFLWKTTRAWRCSCRMFTMTLQDGTSHGAYFQFKR